MVLILLFPIAFVLSVLGLIAAKHRSGRWSVARGGPLLLVLTLGASYLAAFAALNLDPYFDDNGSPEFIALRYRWTWALVFGGFFSLLSVPSAFALRALWLWWRRSSRAEG